MVAPNGARLRKSDHPAVPLSTSELAETAKACCQAGANWFHLHVRDDQGQHSLDVDRYRLAITAIEHAVPEMKIQITTEAAGLFDVTTQLACLEGLRPPAASLSVREIARDPSLRAKTYATAYSIGTLVQHILYSVEDVAALLDGFDTGIIPKQARDVIFVLGRYTEGLTSEPTDLDPFLAAAKGQDLRWSVCAFGQREQECLLYALTQGGNVRVGFENNTLAPDGHPYPDNATSVSNLVTAARALGFSPAKDTQ
jgi:uncharacterized protein (DUF849 family)